MYSTPSHLISWKERQIVTLHGKTSKKVMTRARYMLNKKKI